MKERQERVVSTSAAEDGVATVRLAVRVTAEASIDMTAESKVQLVAAYNEGCVTSTFKVS
jgi:hypothetical protein